MITIFKSAYFPIGVGTYHLETAQAEFEKSVKMLKSIDENITVPDEMLLSVDRLIEYINGVEADLAIVQNITFANAAYVSEILRRLSCPVVLWTLREPKADGTRLRLNSLTGAFSAANTLKAFQRPFEYVLGAPEEEKTKNLISAAVSAAKVKKAMRSLNLLQVGHTPQGFGFGRALDSEMLRIFGVNTVSIEARELIEQAKAFTDDDIAPYLADAKKRICGLDGINGKNVSDFARLYKAYDEYVKANNIGALASRCWPDFFTSFGTPVCSVLGILNDLGVASACEADSFGALSMYICSYLTGKSAFFGDPVAVDEDENTVTFWHCGMAPCSLAREDTGACAGVHCNRKIGPTLEFGCKEQDEVTVFRIGRKPDGTYRFFIAGGSAPDKGKQYYGTSLVVKTANSAPEIINSAVKNGWEPHFAVAMGNISKTLEILAEMLGIEVCRF